MSIPTTFKSSKDEILCDNPFVKFLVLTSFNLIDTSFKAQEMLSTNVDEISDKHTHGVVHWHHIDEVSLPEFPMMQIFFMYAELIKLERSSELLLVSKTMLLIVRFFIGVSYCELIIVIINLNSDIFAMGGWFSGRLK